MKQTLLAWCEAGPCTVPSISYILFSSSESHTQHFSLLGYSLFWKLALRLIASWSPLAGMIFLMVFTFWNLLAIFRTWLKMASSVPRLSCPHSDIPSFLFWTSMAGLLLLSHCTYRNSRWESSLVSKLRMAWTFTGASKKSVDSGTCCMRTKSFSHVWLFVTPWTVAHQPPLSTGFSRQEDWGGFSLPPPGGLPDPGAEPTSPLSPALAGGFFTASATEWAPIHICILAYSVSHEYLTVLWENKTEAPLDLLPVWL